MTNIKPIALSPRAYSAYEQWENKHHGWSKEFVPVDACIYRRLPMVLFYKSGDAMPWSVQYAGNGHYFETEDEARQYIEDRTHRGMARQWRQNNKDKLKRYERDRLRRKYGPEFIAEFAKSAYDIEPPKEENNVS